MSSTNKTPNYDLSQYVGTDKPTYLGDYNGDMLKIDSQMKENADAATNAQASAGEARTKAGQALEEATQLDSRMSTAESAITGLQSTTTSLTENMSSQGQKITSLEGSSELATDFMNDAVWTDFTPIVMNTSIADNVSGNRTLQACYNDALKMLVISGVCQLKTLTGTSQFIGTLPSNIPKPATTRQIGVLCARRDTNNIMLFKSGQIDSSGRILYDGTSEDSNSVLYFQFMYVTKGW